MRPLYPLTTTFLIVCCLIIPVFAQSKSNSMERIQTIQRLLSTYECPSCDLSEADLSKADLSEANLLGANLQKANLKNANLTLC